MSDLETTTAILATSLTCSDPYVSLDLSDLYLYHSFWHFCHRRQGRTYR